jgi:ketosteroid isomerase-like protein
MKKIVMAAAVLTAVLFTGCSGAGGGDPKTVLMAFFEALMKKDMDGAKKLATKDSEAMFSLMEMGMKMAKDSKDMEKFDKTKMEFGEAKIEGDKATVPVKDISSGESTNFILKKENGGWKVAFDKDWFKQTAADKMKEKGMDGALDTLNSGLDKLKEINADSLASKMKEGLEKLNENKDKIEEAAKKLEEATKKLNQ